MYNRSKCLMILIVIGISAIPLASALTESFGGSNSDYSLSTSSNLDLGTSGSITDSSILSFDQGITNQRFGSATLSDPGALDVYLNTENQNKGLYAATYAYLRGSGSRTYSSLEKVGSASVQIGEYIDVDDGYGLFFGGFAYNAKDDYSGVQTINSNYDDDSSVTSMVYSNKLIASTSSTSAYQKLSNFEGDVDMISWSDKGNLENEVTDLAHLFNDEGDPVLGPLYGDVTDEEDDTLTTNNLPMAKAYLTVSTGSSTSNYYTSTTSNSVYSTKASQTLTSKKSLDSIEGFACSTPNEDVGYSRVSISATDLEGKSTYYTNSIVDKPTSTKVSWTGSQTVKIPSASSIVTHVTAASGPDTTTEDRTTAADDVSLQSVEYADASMSLKSTVKGTLSNVDLSSKLTASGNGYHRANAVRAGYSTESTTSISSTSTRTPATLAGYTDIFSGAKSGFEGTSITGKWTASTPVVGSIERDGYSTDGTTTINLNQQATNIRKPTVLTYKFTEDLEASEDALIAL